MINVTLSNLRNSTEFFNIDDIATIVNGRKKEEIGYFIPKTFKKEFEKFILELEQTKKERLLKRIAKASKKDIIGDGTINDGIK